MNLSTPFIHRPVATTLLTVAIALAGIIAFLVLPVAALPEIDYPTIDVSGQLAGRQPGNYGLLGGHATRAPIRAHCGHYGDVLVELSGQHLHCFAV